MTDRIPKRGEKFIIHREEYFVVKLLIALSIIPEEAEAKGCQHNSVAFDASQGRCFHPDTQSAHQTTVEDEEDEEDEDQ